MATGAPNGEFYTEVESFLNRPSPSLAKIAKSSKSTENLLPMLKAERSKLRVEKPDGRTATTATSAASKKTKKPLDLSLVHQAFAYANQLRENQDDDDDYEQDQPIEVEKKHHHAIGTEKPSKPSGKSKQNNGTMKTKTKSTASSIYGGSGNGGASQKTQSKPKAGPDWDSCSKDAPSSHQNTSMDPQLMQQLLSNFQNGTTLAELRQELAASQASLKESRQILQGAAKTFFMKGSIQC
ncbi:hypothetical protein Ae201684P_010606 [Aphanomyces euteiches]|nr:hypothetical protein Ae201684P_010606 [Aphanomyces euteiches]